MNNIDNRIPLDEYNAFDFKPLSTSFDSELKTKLDAWHTTLGFLYPPTGTQSEEIANKSLTALGESTTFVPGGHQRGADIIWHRSDGVSDHMSLKTGSFNTKSKKVLHEEDAAFIRISGSRLTNEAHSPDSLRQFFNELKYETSYLLMFQRFMEYRRYHFPSKLIDLDTIYWSAYFSKDKRGNTKQAGWCGTSCNGVEAKVVFSNSNQLWFDIPVKLILDYRVMLNSFPDTQAEIDDNLKKKRLAEKERFKSIQETPTSLCDLRFGDAHMVVSGSPSSTLVESPKYSLI